MATSSRAERPALVPIDPRLARRRRASREGRGAATPYLYIAPAFVVYAAFLLYPLGRAAQFSLYSWDTVSPAVFVGFGNYVAMAGDPDLLGSFGHAAILILFYCLLPLCLGLVVAAILNRARVDVYKRQLLPGCRPSRRRPRRSRLGRLAWLHRG